MLPDGVTIERAYQVARTMAAEVVRRRVHPDEAASAAGWALAKAMREFRGDHESQFWACLRGMVRTAIADALRDHRWHGLKFNSVRIDRRPRVVSIENALVVFEDRPPLARLIAAETLAMLTPEELALAWALEGSRPIDVARQLGVGRSTVCGWRNRARERVESLA